MLRSRNDLIDHVHPEQSQMQYTSPQKQGEGEGRSVKRGGEGRGRNNPQCMPFEN